MTQDRELSVPGCVNLRDLGGHTTRSGERVARGRLFRSAELPAAGDAAASLVALTRLRRVVDLRMDEEIRKTGKPPLPDGCEWIRLPLFAAVQPHWPAPIDRTPPTTARRYLEMTEIGVPTIVEIVRLLGDAHERPTLIHCVAGRDRTGIVVACLLDLLGLPDEAIAADYALSSVVDDAEGRKASPENIVLLLELVREHFGSVREMLVGSGALPADIQRLRAALLE